jgi:serine/threonine protein kinase
VLHWRRALQVDVWSAGCIYFQLLYGQRPFGDDLSQVCNAPSQESAAAPIHAKEASCFSLKNFRRPIYLHTSVYPQQNLHWLSIAGAATFQDRLRGLAAVASTHLEWRTAFSPQQSILQQRTILNAREVVFPARPAVSQETKVAHYLDVGAHAYVQCRRLTP